MGITINGDDFDRVNDKLGVFFEGFADDLDFAGQQAADAIVQTTLAGIGEGDQPLAPYSKAYQELLDSVGGKFRGTVDLRGVFYKAGQRRKAYKSEARRKLEREGRRAYVSVFAKGKTFTAMTGITRPALGLTDKRSEMSRDLITVDATDTSVTITYSPRARAYMLYHQRGEGKLPKRVWFSANKAAIRANMAKALATALKARAAWFNSH